MGSFSYGDQIELDLPVPNYSFIPICSFTYRYHSVIVISLGLAQSDPKVITVLKFHSQRALFGH
jgi:hypothetical protein